MRAAPLGEDLFAAPAVTKHRSTFPSRWRARPLASESGAEVFQSAASSGLEALLS